MTNEMILGITGTVTGILGFVVSVATASLSFRQHLLDRPRLKLTASALIVNEAFRVIVHAVNEGRRPIEIRSFFLEFPKITHRSEPFISRHPEECIDPIHIKGTVRLEEGGQYTFEQNMSVDTFKQLGKTGMACLIDASNKLHKVEFDTVKMLSIFEKQH